MITGLVAFAYIGRSSSLKESQHFWNLEMRNQSHKQVTFGDIDGIIIQEDYSTPDFF